MEKVSEISSRCRRGATEKADGWQTCLLPQRCSRPVEAHGAEQGYKLPPFHSITSSARASSDGGTVRPSVFAVLRLITSSYLVGAWTGSSAGFSPLRMRST